MIRVMTSLRRIPTIPIDDDKEELKTTRRASLLGGTSWEPSTYSK